MLNRRVGLSFNLGIGKQTSGYLVTPTMRRADSVQPHLRATPAQAILKNWEGDLQHGKTCLRIEPVPRWLRRPHEAWAACTRGLPSLHRAGAWPDGPHLRSPYVRDHAVL